MSAKRVLSILLIVVLALPTLVIHPSVRAQESSGVYWPTAGWRTSTPEEQGMSSEELAAFVNTWAGTLDSLIVIRHGYIVAEMYPSPNGPDAKHMVFSISKAVTGSLLGIAIKEGYVSGLDNPVLSFFPDRTFKNLDANKKALTLKNLSTMSSGFDCGDMVHNFAVSKRMEATDDWLQFALDLPVITEPGTQFDYCNVNTYILSNIISQTTGMTAFEYGKEKLFGPLGITDVVWPSSPNGVTMGYSGVQLTPRDLAKLGYLYLHNGEWDGTQIIPTDYVKTALTGQIPTGWPDLHYGYSGWWVFDSVNIPWALGWGGQYLYAIPHRDLMIIATQGGYSEAVRPMLQGYPMTYAIAALSLVDGTLPENAAGLSKLQDAENAVNNPSPVAVPALPVLVQQISGRTYNLLSPNLLTTGIDSHLVALRQQGSLDSKTMTLTFSEGSEATFAVTFADGETWSVPVGLDGLYRISKGRLSPVGVRGMWITENSFRIEMKYIGTAWVLQLDLNFAPGGVQVVSYEKANGVAQVVPGVMAK